MAAANTFSVMCYNVAGLPALISSGNPTTYSVDMGKCINKWDIVNVQEDFNYHDELYSENKHNYRTQSSGGVLFGSGLNTLSSFPFSNVTYLERVKWDDCDNYEGADCMTPKGFALIAVELADGVMIDIYNLHADAGVTKADSKARASNLAQLSDYMFTNSADNAIIVMGDTNCRYTREGDAICEFIEQQQLTDGWIELIRKGDFPKKRAQAIKCETASMTNQCEVVDKIMYRGNNFIKLTLDKWNNENQAFLGTDGSPLSDHPPISAAFSYTLNPDIKISRAFGGSHGTYFTDVGLATAGQTITSISIRAGERVDAVTMVVSDPTESTLNHGGLGGTFVRLALKSGEYIVSMEVHWEEKKSQTRIFFVKLMTSKGRWVKGGTPTAQSTVVHAPKGYQISGFHGRSSENINALGATFTTIDSTPQQLNLHITRN